MTAALDRLDRLLRALPPGAEADARLLESHATTMRFAVGRVHQPHVEAFQVLSLRVGLGRRLATATTSDLSPAGLRSVIDSAVALARSAPEEPRFPGFPAPSGRAPSAVAVSRETERAGAAEAGGFARRLLQSAQEHAPASEVAGAVHLGGERLAVANTSGLRRSTRRSFLQASALVEYPDRAHPRSGWAETSEWDHRRFRPEALGAEAAGRCPAESPVAAPPGSYRVVLGSAAVAEMLALIGYLGFGGNAEVEGWSCLARSRGRRVVAPSVTLVDDGRDPGMLPQAIDYEGTAKRRTVLFDRGVAGPAVTDLLSGARLGRASSGHALAPESPSGDWGPVPTQMALAPGDASEEELIAEAGNGLFVNRFFYVRVVHPARSVITGMTRDGTYRIRRGELAEPVRNLRFTQSILATLARTELLGRHRRRYSDERGDHAVSTPALLSRGFRFTSATLF